MQRIQKTMYWAVIVSEASHIFCCVLPTLFSVLSLLAGLGLASALPPGLVAIHDALHDWELTIIAASGLVLAAGWGIDYYARKVDCHNTGCVHEPCGPQKRRAHIVLKIATVLFVINVFVYAVIHRGMDIGFGSINIEAAHDHEHGHSHGHDHDHGHEGHAH